MDHIERFEDLVTSMKHDGVSYDYLFCKLFPHSLGGEAAYWLKQLPTGSLTNWEDTKRAFLRKFYDDARSEELRNNIWQFSQRPTEAFKAAWVRFRVYQRDCPHHGFSQVQLLGIFFRGVDWRYQMALDTASNGNFNTRSPEQAAELIENLASSNSTKNADYERQKMVGNTDGNQQGRGSYNGTGQSNNSFIRNNGSSSYQTPSAQTEQNEMIVMLQQLLEGHQKNMIEINGKIEALSTHVKKLDIQVAQTVGAVKMQERVLPGRTDTNPEYQCIAITAEYGKELNTVLEKGFSAEELVEIEEIEDEFLAELCVSIDTPVHRSTQIKSSKYAELEAPASIDTHLVSIDTSNHHVSNITRIDRFTPCIDRHTSKSVTPNIEKPKVVEEQVYKPRVPYPRQPRHLMNPISPKQLLSFHKMVRKIPHTLTFEEALECRPLLSHF